MKRLTCEVCGSTDMIKQEGVFVCQACGCKYTVEEVRKMMVEGTVEVTGTVKVDTNEKVSNLYVLARRAKDENNAADAKKYYEMILLEDPKSLEAVFYTAYFRLFDSSIGELKTNASRFMSGIESAIRMTIDTLSGDDRKNALDEYANKAIGGYNLLSNIAVKQLEHRALSKPINVDYGMNINECVDLMNQLIGSIQRLSEMLQKSSPNEEEGYLINLYKTEDSLYPRRNQFSNDLDRLMTYKRIAFLDDKLSRKGYKSLADEAAQRLLSDKDKYLKTKEQYRNENR